MYRLALALLLMAAPLHPAAADPLDFLFYTPHFEATDPASELIYDHARTSTLQDRLGPDTETVIALTRVPNGSQLETVITLDAEGAARQLDSFRDVPGNPILMVFMETIVGSISRATGGSPFYIRNRIKEAFAKGAVASNGEATRLTFKPFENDRNRARMGPFADLAIVIEMNAALPGMFKSLRAQTPGPGEPAYSEEMSYVEAS